MLVLGRKINEPIYIETPDGDVIEIVPVQIGSSVRIGIKAARKFNIRRAELPELPEAAAADVSPADLQTA